MFWWKRKSSPKAKEKPSEQTSGDPSGEGNEGAEQIKRSEFLHKGTDLLRGFTSHMREVTTDTSSEEFVTPMRPPGAVAEADFIRLCTHCNACIEACHQDVILVGHAGSGVRSGTPYLDVERNPCYLCTDPVCASACKSGALVPLLRAQIRLGVADIRVDLCLSWQEQACDLCIQVCPYSGDAILAAEGGRVVIDPEFCVGCGLCYHECPTTPRAIEIFPAER